MLRAGLIAMPLPLLWRRADAIARSAGVGASALIVSGRIGATDHFDLAVNVAAEVFTVRQVCGFGPDPPDGAISLDDLDAAQRHAMPKPRPASAPPRPDAARIWLPSPGTWRRTDWSRSRAAMPS